LTDIGELDLGIFEGIEVGLKILVNIEVDECTYIGKYRGRLGIIGKNIGGQLYVY
jgi:hypothetical protein